MKYPKLIFALSLLLLTTVAAFATTISGTTSVCTGRTTSLSIDTSGGTWSSANTARATVNPTTGLVSGIAAGTVLISYNLPAATFTAVVSVITSPIAISGLSAICEGTTTTLTNPMGSGTWSSADPSVATIGLGSGLLTAIDAGTVTITYTQYTGCFNTRIQTINVVPAAITGGSSTCVGTPTTLSSAPAGGIWTSSSISVATVGSASGIVNGTAGGGTTISYSLPTGCRRTIAFSVVNLPAAISGSLLTCVGNTTTLTSTTGGGTWASSNPTVASVGTGAGVVTAVSTGTAIITYTVGTGCRRTAIVTVNAGISAIAGEPAICLGSTSALTNATGGGTWSSSNTPKATVHISTGIVTPVSAGTAIISYKTGAACYSTLQVTVSSALAAITGTTGFCTGTTTTLSHPIAGGTWSSSNTAKATVGISSGVVTGVSSGTATITYTLSSGCRKTINVLVNATIPAIGGATAVCQGANITLTNSSGGGTWTSTNTAVATIISSSGIMTGISAGTTTISYLVASGCYATRIMTVHATPAAISGSTVICTGSTAPFTTTPSGGTWYSSSVSVATVGAASGIVTAITGGGTTISYVLPTGCRTTKAVTVSAAPAAITGTATVNITATSTLNSATPGGSWTSSNTGVATIGSSSGIVTGISAGTTVITYAMGVSCYTTRIVTVSTACSISGTLTLCTGNTTTLTATGGGTWTSTVPSVATIGISSGIVSALASGTTTIAYTTAGGCTSSAVVTVYAMPSSITGTATLCTGAATTLANSVSGGTWTSGNTTVATIGAATGIVAGLTAGTTTISYTTGTGCATTTIVTVSATPAAITGTATTCVGATTTLANATAGGTWTSVSTSVATIGSATGIATAIAAGTSMISYILPSGCYTTRVQTINSNPAAITGTTTVNEAATTTLENATAGGTWTSSNIAVATAGSATGIVSGITAGTAVISYTLSSGCYVTTTVTVLAVCNISGTLAICPAATTTLSTLSGGGTWTSVSTGVATMGSASGIVTGVAAGTTTISYNSGTGCISTVTLTVNSNPATIAGPAVLCAATTATQTNTTSGGTWTSATPAIATIGSASGIATGISAGITTISYILNPSGCYTTRNVTVNEATGASISGSSVVCIGRTTTLSPSAGGGTWASSAPSKATVNSTTGVVTGVSTGTTLISYTSGGCVSSITMTVYANPAALTGTNSVNIGSTTTFSSATSGGTWSSSNTTVGTVGTSGIITGISAGTATITYTIPATTCFVTRNVTIINPCAITGSLISCIDFSLTLGSPISGGTWTSTNTAVATIGSSTGTVTGHTAGTTTISYVTGGGCTSAAVVTVNSTPGAITGAATVCVNATTVLNASPAGGTWSSSNTAIGSINSATRTVNGLGAGTVTMSYILSASCYATHTMTINPAAGTISGPSGICLGSTIILTSDSTGGIWTSSSSAVASVGSATGIVSSAGIGTVTVSYTMPEGCFATRVISSDTLPVLTTITYGSSTVEVGKSIFLINCYEEPSEGVYLPYGGYWASSDISVGVLPSSPWYQAQLTGVSTGTVNVMFILTNGCGADTVNKIVTVEAPTCPTVWEYCGGGEDLIRNGGSHPSPSNVDIAIGRDGNPVVCIDEEGSVYARKLVDGKFEPLLDSIDLKLADNPSYDIFGPHNTPSVAIDDSGYTHVAYRDYAGMIRVKKHDGNKWVYVGNPFAGFSHLSLIIAATGDFYINYVGHDGVIQVRKFDGTDWVSLGATGLEASLYKHGFDVAGDGTPFIEGYAGEDVYSVRKFSGGAWTTVGSSTYSSYYNSRSMSIDPSGIPYITTGTSIVKIVDGVSYDIGTSGLDPGFLDALSILKFDKNGILYVLSTATPKGRMAKYNGSTWSYIGGPISQRYIPTDIEMSHTIRFALDYSGKPYVAITETNHYTSAVYMFDGIAWKSLAAHDRISNRASISAHMIMKDDTAVVVYSEENLGFKPVVKKQVGNNWEYIGTPGFSAGSVYEKISLAKDTGEALYVAYADESLGSKITVKKFSGSDWVTVGSASFSAGAAASINIIVADNGIPYVAYNDAGNGNKAIVMKYNGTSWIAPADAAASSVPVASVSMDISSSGTPYVAYVVAVELSDVAGELHVVKLNGSTWETVASTIPGVVTGITNFSDGAKIKLDNSDIPHILYGTANYGSLGGELRVRKFDGTNWMSFGSPYIWNSRSVPFGSPQAKTISMSFDNTNVPYVGYGQILWGYTPHGVEVTIAHVSKYDGIDWVEVGRPILMPTENMLLALSGSGIPYIAHVGLKPDEDIYAASSLTVLRLADNRIKGNLNTCPGYVSDMFTTDTTTGTWSSSNTAVASINAFGLVTGISPGTTTISYNASGCIITAVVTVNEAPAAGTLSGTATVAVSGTTTFASTITGGVWSTSSPAVATVDASSGVVTGIATGTATITYAHANSCGLAIATRTVNVTAARPGTTTGGQSVFMVYPNPTSGSLNVESAIEGTVKVSTIDGREIKEYKISKGSTQLALPAALTAGIYMFRFAGNDGTSNIVRLVYEPQ